MTNLTGNIILSVGNEYTLRTWIEYGFKQVKTELEWHDYRLTDYKSIERWWELVFSAYLLISLQADQLKQHQQRNARRETILSQPSLFKQHPDKEAGTTWKSILNNLRLLLQPYGCWAWLERQGWFIWKRIMTELDSFVEIW